MAGIFYKGSVDGVIPEKEQIIINNAVTAGDRIAFYSEDIVTKSEYPLAETENSEYDGTYTAGNED